MFLRPLQPLSPRRELVECAQAWLEGSAGEEAVDGTSQPTIRKLGPGNWSTQNRARVIAMEGKSESRKAIALDGVGELQLSERRISKPTRKTLLSPPGRKHGTRLGRVAATFTLISSLNSQQTPSPILHQLAGTEKLRKSQE